MNAQELFDAFRDIDPAWLKEADQLADRAAEQSPGMASQNAAENEIQQIFAQYSGSKANETVRRITEYKTETKSSDFADLTGKASDLPAERTMPAPVPAEQGSGRVFRVLGGIAAAVAIFCLGTFVGSVITYRNGGMTVTPAAMPALQEQTKNSGETPTDGVISEGYYFEYDENGNMVEEFVGNTNYTVYYQDLRLIDNHVDMYDGAAYFMSGAFRVPNIYQPAGTPVELTVQPDADEILPGCEYRVVLQQDDEVLDITDLESGETKKSFIFKSTEDSEQNTKKISVMPDYTNEGSLIKMYIIVSSPSGRYCRNDSCMFRLYTAEPGASCTYKIDSSSTKISSFYSE